MTTMEAPSWLRFADAGCQEGASVTMADLDCILEQVTGVPADCVAAKLAVCSCAEIRELQCCLLRQLEDAAKCPERPVSIGGIETWDHEKYVRTLRDTIKFLQEYCEDKSKSEAFSGFAGKRTCRPCCGNNLL